MNEAQQKKAEGIPPKYRGVYTEAVTSNRRQLAIRAFCLECVAWNAAEVRRCTAPACPLYAYRNGGKPGDDTGEDFPNPHP